MYQLPDFATIAYLQTGSPLQQEAFKVITNSKILYHLQAYRPVLAGTMPLDIFIEGQSDLDFLLQSADLKSVEKVLLTHFGIMPGFELRTTVVRSEPTVICHFQLGRFPAEIFCQATPVEKQAAYRHMVVEYLLLQKHGGRLKEQLIELKRSGVKTEPAFARLLGLRGDPYQALLNFEIDL